MVRFLDAVRESGKVLAVHIADRLGIFDAQDAPHGDGVITRAKPLLPGCQPFLLPLHRFEIEGGNLREDRLGRGAESLHGIFSKAIRSADQPTVLAAIDAPYERLVRAIELLDALVRLDHLRSGYGDAPLSGYHDA